MRSVFRPVLGVIVLICLIAVGLIACGGGDGGDSTSGSETAAPTEISGTVTIWDFEYESAPTYTEAVDQLDAEFEQANPDVTVNRVAQPFENYEPLIRAAFTSREGPDIMQMQPGQALSFTNGLEVLNDRISPELQDSLTQWGSVTSGYGEEGDHYGVPFGENGLVFYYNKKLFKAAGLPTDFKPKSWPEIREAGETLKRAGIQPFTGGAKDGNENLWWFALGFQTENTFEQAVEMAEGEMSFTDEAVASAFGPDIEMQEAGLYPDDRFTTDLFTEGFPSFAEGKGAMVLGLMAGVGYWAEFNPELGEKNVGWFAAPSPEIGTFCSYALSIPTFAKNKDAAWALIDFLASKESIETLHEVGGKLPNRIDAVLPASDPIQAHELVDQLHGANTVTSPDAMVPSAVAFGPIFTETSQVLQGRTSLEDAQQVMQETAEKTGS